jgi:hypothetical protein
VARRRGQRHDDDEGGDFSIKLGADSNVPAPTVELETADLKEMSLAGEAKTKAALVIQTADGKHIELEPGWSQGGASQSIIVEDGLVPQPAQVQRVVPKQPRLKTEATRGRSGAWLVVLVYHAAGTALGLAIYERFVA